MVNEEWQRFYPFKWKLDRFVQTADAKVIGTYITLLTHQMTEGSLPDNVEELHRLAPRDLTLDEFKEIWSKSLAKKFEPVTRRWVSEGNEPNEGHEEPFERPGEIQQWFLARVMATGARMKQVYAARSVRASEKRWGKQVVQPQTTAPEDREESEIDEDLNPLVAAVKKGAGDVLVGNLSATRQQIQQLGRHDLKTLQIVGEYLAARQHWGQRNGDVAFTLSRLLAKNFQETVMNAKEWDRRGRVAAGDSNTGMVKPIGPQAKTQEIDL